MEHKDTLAIIIGILSYGAVFGGLAVCIIIALRKKDKD